jgi:hypothetical protein
MTAALETAWATAPALLSGALYLAAFALIALLLWSIDR